MSAARFPENDPKYRLFVLASLVLALLLVNGMASAQNPQPIFPFITQINLPDASLSTPAATADFNGDGIPDLAYITSTTSNGELQYSLNVALSFGQAGSTTVTTPVCLSQQAPVQFAVGDVNNDKKPDVVFTCNGYFTVLLGKDDGSFQAPAYYALNTNAPALLVDLNHDGYPDVAVVVPAIDNTAQLAVFLNKGAAPPGDFGTPQMYSLPVDSGETLLAGDFNGDGKQDLLTKTETNFVLLFGNGDGTLQATQTQPFPEGGYVAFATGDFNHDGITDIATVSLLPTSPTFLQILFGSTLGTFTRGPTVPIAPSNPPESIRSMAAADLTGDGNLDLVVDGDLTYIFLSDGKGTFTQTGSYSVSGTPMVADVNGDGRPDLLLQGFNGIPAVFILPGNGYGTFQAPPGTHVSGLSGDVNDDGISDLVYIVLPPNINQPGPSFVGTALGRGDGTFAALNQTASIPGRSIAGYFLEIGDFNGDGKVDAVAVQAGYPGTACGPQPTPSQNAELFPYVGNGNGTFQPKGSGIDLGAVVAVKRGLVGDFNGDGKLDLILPYYSFPDCGNTQGLLFIPGNGDGTFGTPVAFSPASGNISNLNIVAGDLNNDGKLDFIWSFNNAVYLGNGDGTFKQVPLNIQIPQSAPVALADINGDGILDLIAGPSVYAGNGDGSFQTTPLYTVSLPQYSTVLTAAAGDVTGDGNPDLIEAYLDPNSGPAVQFALSIGDGHGNFTPDSHNYYVGQQPVGITASPSMVLTRLNNSAPTSHDRTLDVLTSVGGVYTSSMLDQLNAAPGKPTPFGATTVLQASSTTASTGAAITLTATVTGISPTGSVSFAANRTNIGTAPILDGTATLQTSFVNAGSFAVTAVYAGDQNNSASTSNRVTIAVATPDFKISLQPSTATISPGQSTTFALTVAPTGGFAGTVKFSCGSLPSEATCSFSPASVTPANGATASTTLTVTTTAATSAKLESNGPFAPQIPTTTLALAGILGFAVTFRKTRRWNRLLRSLSGLSLLIALFLPLVGCGGGSHPPANPGTPPGSYTISVNAADAASGLQHATTVILSVQ